MRFLTLLAMAMLVGCNQMGPSRPFAVTQLESIDTPAPAADMLRYGVRVRATGPRGLTQYGSGVLVPGGVLTAAHVVKGCLVAHLEHNGESQQSVLFTRDDEADVAFIKCSFSGLPAKLMDSGELQPGDVLVSVGRHDDGELRAQTHTLTRRTRWGQHGVLDVAPAFNQGRSGGGVFTADGRLAGIITAMSADEKQGYASDSIAYTAVMPKAAESAAVAQGEPKLVAYVATSKTCVPCQAFKRMNGDGNSDLRIVYIDTGEPPRADVPDAADSTARATPKPMPFALWETDKGWVAQVCSGYTVNRLHSWVAFSAKR